MPSTRIELLTSHLPMLQAKGWQQHIHKDLAATHRQTLVQVPQVIKDNHLPNRRVNIPNAPPENNLPTDIASLLPVTLPEDNPPACPPLRL